jgi:hypothetical protein
MSSYYPEWAKGWFHFTDAQWENIRKAVGPGQGEGEFRWKLEARVTQFLKNRKEPRFGTVRERNAMKSIASLSKKLRKRLETIDHRAWHNSSDIGMAISPAVYGKEYRKWNSLIADLHEAERRALEQVPLIKRRRGSINPARKLLWWHAIELYAQFTGRKVGASNPSSGKGDAYGPCIRFLIAFTSNVPNEKKPKGHQLRAVIREYQRLRRQTPQT